jgi:hypothetical protein
MNAMISVVVSRGHKSYCSQAPALCLARFDELAAVGLDAFTKRWDPYWDVPLNESLPEAVIELPTLTTQPGSLTMGQTDQVF